jgi:hypothetical protein
VADYAAKHQIVLIDRFRFSEFVNKAYPIVDSVEFASVMCAHCGAVERMRVGDEPIDVVCKCGQKVVNTITNRDFRAREAGQRRLLSQDAVLALIVFLLSCALIVFTWDNTTLGRGAMMSCLVASPILAGLSGAFIRKVADVFQGAASARGNDNWLSLGALGGVAGGFSGLLFVMAQLTATPTIVDHRLPAQVSRLVPFAMITGFLAGFTADLVYGKLREAKNLEGNFVPEVLKAGGSSINEISNAQRRPGN